MKGERGTTNSDERTELTAGYEPPAIKEVYDIRGELIGGCPGLGGYGGGSF